MSGKELARQQRDSEIIRLYVEEGLSPRQISKVVPVSHVTAWKVLKQQIAISGEEIQARRSALGEMYENLIDELYEKCLRTGHPNDIAAFVRLTEGYKNLFGLNAPTATVNVEVTDYGEYWANHFDQKRTIDGTFDEQS